MTQTVTEPVTSVRQSDESADRRLPVLLALGLAVAGGLLTLLAFPNTYWWPLAPVGVALLAVAVHRQRARVGALLGLVYGVAFFPILLYWVRVVGYDAWAVLSLIESLYVAGMAALFFWSDAVMNVALVVPWVGTAMILAVAFGVPPWRAAYTEAVIGLPDAVRLRRLVASWRSHRLARVTLDYLVSLRPAWWLVRAWAAVVLVNGLIAGGGVPVPGVLAPLVLVAVVASVWLGMRNKVNAGWNALTAPGNVLAAIVVLASLAG